MYFTYINSSVYLLIPNSQFIPPHAISPLVAISLGFPGGSVVKNPPANSGGVGSIPEMGRFPGEGKGNTLQYSCLGNLMDREKPGGPQSMQSQRVRYYLGNKNKSKPCLFSMSGSLFLLCK